MGKVPDGGALGLYWGGGFGRRVPCYATPMFGFCAGNFAADHTWAGISMMRGAAGFRTGAEAVGAAAREFRLSASERSDLLLGYCTPTGRAFDFVRMFEMAEPWGRL